MTTSTFDTSIVSLINDTCIVQHLKSENIYLVNNTTGYVLADYQDGKWVSWNTKEVSLQISSYDLDNTTNIDSVSDWKVIA